MNRITYILVIPFLSISAAFSQTTLSKQADSLPPLVGVPDFDNRTGDQLARVAPGVYREENVRIGTDSRRESENENGKSVESNSTRDVYEKQLRRDIEYAPGEWTLPAQAGKIAADEIAAVLTQSKNFRVLSRSFASNDIREKERQLAMRFTPQEYVNLFKDSKADYILIGSVSGFRVDETKGRSYGTDFITISTRVTLDLKLLNVATGEIVYQGAPIKSIVLPLPAGVTSTAVYDWEASLRAAIRETANDMTVELADFGSKATNAIQAARVKIDSSPAGAEVIVDGDFLGNTPLNASLRLGRQNIRLELQGYQPWERTVNVTEGSNIKPKLTKIEELSTK